MKSFLAVALVLGVWSVAALADSTETPLTSDEIEEKGFKECNATIPVQRNPAEAIVQSIVAGDRIHLSPQEKCNLYCFLQKVHFFDENGDLRGTAVFNHTLKEAPILANHSDVLITQIFQIVRSTKGFQDKCLKAFVCFHQYITNIFTLAMAESLQSYTDVRSKIVSAVDGHNHLPSDLETQIKELLKLLDSVTKAIAKPSTPSLVTTAITSEPTQVKPPIV